jgi:hypothetical protein
MSYHLVEVYPLERTTTRDDPFGCSDTGIALPFNTDTGGFMSYVDFSSWPRDQEQTFVVFEERSNNAQRAATVGGIIAGLAFLFGGLGIYAGVDYDKRENTAGMHMENLSRDKKTSAPAPTPAPAAAPAPKQDQPPADKPADKPADPPK